MAVSIGRRCVMRPFTPLPVDDVAAAEVVSAVIEAVRTGLCALQRRASFRATSDEEPPRRFHSNTMARKDD